MLFRFVRSGVVTSDLTDSYPIRAAVPSDLADSYTISASVSADLSDGYSVLAAVTADLVDGYAIVTAVSSSLSDSYTIESSGGGSYPTVADIAAGVLAAAQVTPIHSNTQLINDAEVMGDGTEGNDWRGVGVQPQ